MAGTPHDESDSIEWKSTLDLTSTEGGFAVARTVLGMGNRMPEVAGRAFEGVGYVLVGAEPGNLAGVASVDPAVLSQVIESYVGAAEGPRWTPVYLPVRGVMVLVVTVEAPRRGDRIFTLRRQFKDCLESTVFVRKGGRTARATASDMDALQSRLTAGPRLEPGTFGVRIVGDSPLPWFDGESMAATVEAWADRRGKEMIDRAEALERQRRIDSAEPNLAGTGLPAHLGAMARNFEAARASGLLGQVVGEEDKRTLEEYTAEVDSWRQRAVENAQERLPGLYVAGGHGAVAVAADNQGGRFLTDVEVEVTFDDDRARGLAKKPDPIGEVSPPREFGERQRHGWFDVGVPTVSGYIPDIGVVRPRPRAWVDNEPLIITFAVGNLRQHATDRSPALFILLCGRPEAGVLHGTWKATARDVEGVLMGAVDVPVAKEPIQIEALLG